MVVANCGDCCVLCDPLEILYKNLSGAAPARSQAEISGNISLTESRNPLSNIRYRRPDRRRSIAGASQYAIFRQTN